MQLTNSWDISREDLPWLTAAGATAFKAICGSSPAVAATFASVAVPEMDRYGYAKKLSTGIVATVVRWVFLFHQVLFLSCMGL
jgi:TRAP-type C4-dicarboxylate transport system permease large subunit